MKRKQILSLTIVCIIWLSTVSALTNTARATSISIYLGSRKTDNSTTNLGTIVFEPESTPYPIVPNLPRTISRDTRTNPYQATFYPPSQHVIDHWEYSGGINVPDAGLPMPLINVYVTGPGSANLIAVYKYVPPQRTLTVSSAHDSPVPGNGPHTYGDGQSVTCSVSSPVVDGGVSYACTGWSGTGSVPASGSATSVTFTITQDSSITWLWSTIYYTLNVNSAHDSPNPSNGPHQYQSGSLLTCSVSSPVTEGSTLWTCTGWMGTGSVPASGSATSVTFTISQDSSITWNWIVVQRTLTVNSAHGSPNPSVGSHTYNAGDSVTCSVSSPVTEGSTVWTCTGWTGTGSVPASGTGVSVVFTITQDSTITWNWHGTAVQLTLTVVSAHDSPSPGVGDHLYDDGSSVTCSVTSPVTEGSTVWTCIGWSGTGSVPASGTGKTTTFTITQDSTITWIWEGSAVQRKLTVSCAHDSPNPANGDTYWGDGQSVTCSVTTPVTEGSTLWTCTGWSGTGSVPSSGTGNTVTFSITQDSSITWNWQGSAVQRRLTVGSAHDSPVPGNGPHTYNNGDSVTCSVSSPVTEGGVSYSCTGWTGTGSVQSSGTGTSTTFTITQDSSITWNWIVVQRSLTVISAHDSPNPSVGSHTYNAGTPVACSVSSPVTEGGITYYCIGWSGSGSVQASGSGTSVTFTITMDSTIIWNWKIAQRRLTVSSAHDSPNPSVGSHTYNDGQSVTCSVTSPVTEGGVTYVCIGWSGTGSVASSGTGKTVTFTITQDSTITWNWQKLGNLLALNIQAIQTILGADLVQGKPTTFSVTYSSSFFEEKAGWVRIDLEGFDYSSWTFKITFKPNGIYSFWLHSEDLKAPTITPTAQSSAGCKVTLDVFNEIDEFSDNDNVYPASGMQQSKVSNTQGLKVLFVRLHHEDEPDNRRITGTQAYTYMSKAWEFFTATYPVAPSEVTFDLSPEPLLVERGRDFVWVCERLSQRILTGIWPFQSYTYDRIVGIASDWAGPPGAGWDSGNPMLFDGGLGIMYWYNKRAVIVKNVLDATVAHEIGHTFFLGDDYQTNMPRPPGATGVNICKIYSGYWVLKRKPVTSAATFMHEGGFVKYWVDDVDYGILMEKLLGKDPEIVLVSGSMSRNGTVRFSDNFFRVSDGKVDLGNSIGDHYIALLDENGNMLDRIGFNVTYFCMSDPPVELEEVSFCFSVRWVDGTRIIQVLDAQGSVLASKSISQSPPSVHLISPNGDEIFVPGTNYTITWSAIDPDNDPLTYNILIGNSKESTPVPIATDINQTSFTYSFGNLPGGTQYLIYVLATDGVNVVGDVSDGFFTISSFALDVVTAPQTIPQEGKINCTINVSSYGGFSGQVTLDASSATGDLAFRWVDGSTVTLAANGFVIATLEVDATNTTGGSHTIAVSGTSGNCTAMAMASVYVISHNIAVLNIVSSKTVIAEGLDMTVNATVQNQGSYSEEFSLCLYCNSTLITNQTVHLHAGTLTTAVLVWNITGFTKGTYAMSVYVWPVENETDIDNNIFEGQSVIISILGDVNGDGEVNILDVSAAARAYRSMYGESTFAPNADMNEDGVINIVDISVIAKQYGRTA